MSLARMLIENALLPTRELPSRRRSRCGESGPQAMDGSEAPLTVAGIEKSDLSQVEPFVDHQHSEQQPAPKLLGVCCELFAAQAHGVEQVKVVNRIVILSEQRLRAVRNGFRPPSGPRSKRNERANGSKTGCASLTSPTSMPAAFAMRAVRTSTRLTSSESWMLGNRAMAS